MASRDEQYLELIQALLDCESGRENEILSQNVELLDQGFLVMVGAVAQQLEEAGNANLARFLENLAEEVATALRIDPPQPPLEKGGEEQAGSFLGDRYRLRTISSLQILSYCQSRPAIANPQYATVENATNDLPFAGFEGEQVAKIFDIPCDRRLKGQTEATPENYRKALYCRGLPW